MIYLLALALLSFYSAGLAWKYMQLPDQSIWLCVAHTFFTLCGICASSFLFLRCLFAVLQNETHIEAVKKSAWEKEAQRNRKEGSPVNGYSPSNRHVGRTGRAPK